MSNLTWNFEKCVNLDASSHSSIKKITKFQNHWAKNRQTSHIIKSKGIILYKMNLLERSYTLWNTVLVVARELEEEDVNSKKQSYFQKKKNTISAWNESLGYILMEFSLDLDLESFKDFKSWKSLYFCLDSSIFYHFHH